MIYLIKKKNKKILKMHDQNTDLHEIPIDGSFSQIFYIKYNSAAISKKSVYNILGQRVGNH